MNHLIRTVSAKLKLNGDQVEYLVALTRADQAALVEEIAELRFRLGDVEPDEFTAKRLELLTRKIGLGASILTKFGRKPFPKSFDRVTRVTQS